MEVWPPRTEVYFQDERFVHPIDTQVRFEAVVYNALKPTVTWEVRGLAGSPGLGSIDESGLYHAPPKGSLPSGHTEMVIATPTEEPLRKAYAWVTLVGEGPQPAPAPRIEIWPKRVHLYYPQSTLADHRNSLIDDSNKQQLFEAKIWNSSVSQVEWRVDNVVQGGITDPWFLYQVSGSGSTEMVSVTAAIQGQPAVVDEARVIQINYFWPRMKAVSDL